MVLQHFLVPEKVPWGWLGHSGVGLTLNKFKTKILNYVSKKI
jgi:hypothetical protein